MKTQRLIGAIAGIIATIVLVAAAVLIFRDGRVVLSAEYRGEGGIGMITTDDLKTKAGEKKSFMLFVSQPE